MLGLLAKSEEGLSTDDFAVLFHLGQFVRLDFANFFIKGDNVSRKGEDRFEFFGFNKTENLFWDGIRGPLNLLILIVLIMPAAGFLKVAKCRCLGLSIRRRMNLAAEAYIFGSFDRLFKLAQL